MNDAVARPLLPEGYFWITSGHKLRVARKVGERDGLWLLDVFRNPEDAYAERAMQKAAEYRPT